MRLYFIFAILTIYGFTHLWIIWFEPETEHISNVWLINPTKILDHYIQSRRYIPVILQSA